MLTSGSKLACLGLLLGFLGCSSDGSRAQDGIVVGLLLPFTGSSSATASNLERATRYAADRINAGGGIDGTNIRILPRDTHSEIGRGVDAARMLADEGAVAVIGPESAEIAEQIRPVLAEKNVVFLSPLVGASAEPSLDCNAPWFCLAPSAKALGEALAKQAFDHMTRIAVFYVTSPYDRALGSAAATRFVQLGGEVALELELKPDAQSYAREISDAINANVTGAILSMSPRTAAIFVNEFAVLDSKRPQWFLSSLLKTDLFIQNVVPEALEGALGVAPKIYERDDGFAEAFSERWVGDLPLEGAYFYYDAMALLAVALARSANDASLTMSQAVLQASAPPGEALTWNKIETGLDRLRRRDALYYSGLTGPLKFHPCGARRTGITAEWAVRRGTIVDTQ